MTFVSRPSLSAIYIRGLFLNPYLLCVLYVCRFYYAVSLPNNKKKQKQKQNKEKNNSSASVLNSYNLTILRCILFEKSCVSAEIYTFRIFICSLYCFCFLSSPWGSVCCFFSHEEHEDMFFLFFLFCTRTCCCHGKWTFFGSSIFLVAENPYDRRSQIRFWILPKKRTLNLSVLWSYRHCYLSYT